MWLGLSNAFLSIVAHRDKPDHLLIRARKEGHIENIFPEAEVSCTPDADYRFRAVIERSIVSKVISAQIEATSYDNFKNSVNDSGLHDAYMDMWSTMYHYQNKT